MVVSSDEAIKKGISDLNVLMLDVAVDKKNMEYLLYVLGDYEPKRDRTGQFKVALNEAIERALDKVRTYKPLDLRELLSLYRHWLETGKALTWIADKLDEMLGMNLITPNMLNDNFFVYKYPATMPDGETTSVKVYVPDMRPYTPLTDYISIRYDIPNDRIRLIGEELKIRRATLKRSVIDIQKSPLAREVHRLFDIAVNTEQAKLAEAAVKRAREINTDDAWMEAERLSRGSLEYH